MRTLDGRPDGLLVGRAYADRVLSFINIEGNLAPEDCFLSRQIIDFPASGPHSFLDGFTERVAQRPEYASRLYARSLATKVRASSVEPIFRSMVALSDHSLLLEIMAELPFPRLFIHGEQNRALSYLGRLPKIGVSVAEIPFAAHFPMYSNPVALWSTMAEFLMGVERTR